MLVRLSDLLSLQKKSKFKANFGQKSGKFKFFTCSPTQDKFIDEFIFDQESLIIGTGGAASIHYCNEPFATSTDCLVLYAKSTNNFNIKYIYYYLKGKKDVLQKGFHGSGLQHISKNYVLNITVNLPSLEQQNFIVKYFDSIENIQTNTDKCILDLELLIKSQFIEMFAHKYEMVDIDSLSTIIMGQSPSGDTYNTNQDGLPFYQGKTDFGNLYINSSKVYTSKPKKIAEEGDVLLSVRAPVGSTNLSICQCCIGRGLAAIRPKENLSNQLYLLYSLREQENEIKNCGVGSTFDCISKNQIMRIKIYNAPFYEQSKFASFVEQIDKSKIIVFIGTF